MKTNDTTKPMVAADKPSVISVDEIQAGIAALSELQAKMPSLVTLTPAERQQLRRVGVQTQRGIVNNLQAARQHREALPAAFDLRQFEADVALMGAMAEYVTALEGMRSKARDTLASVGTRAFQAAIEARGHIHVVSARMAGMKRTVAQLSTRASRRRKDKPEPQPASGPGSAATPVVAPPSSAQPAPQAPPAAPAVPPETPPAEPGHPKAA